MSRFRLGDKVWFVCTPSVSECIKKGIYTPYYTVVDMKSHSLVTGMQLSADGTERVSRYFCHEDKQEYDTNEETDTPFSTKREALAEAIRQNEGLASALTLEIARLKEELASCKD